MSDMINDASIGIPCKGCGRKTEKSIGWIKTHNEFVCACGTKITIDASHFKSEIAKVENALSDLKSAFKNFGR